MINDKTVTMSRELAEKVDDVLYIMTGEDSYQRLVQKYGTGWWGALTEMRAELRAILAAPVVERQESDLEIAARLVEGKTVSVDVSTCDEDAGNRLFCKIVEVMEDGDSFTLLAVDPEPNFEASPPAPVAVLLPTVLSAESGPHYSENRASELGYMAGYNACLDKVKELNQWLPIADKKTGD